MARRVAAALVAALMAVPGFGLAPAVQAQTSDPVINALVHNLTQAVPDLPRLGPLWSWVDDFQTNPANDGLWTLSNTRQVWNNEWESLLLRDEQATPDLTEAWRDLEPPSAIAGLPTTDQLTAYSSIDLWSRSWDAEFRYNAYRPGGLNMPGFSFLFYSTRTLPGWTTLDAYTPPVWGVWRGPGYALELHAHELRLVHYDGSTGTTMAAVQDDRLLDAAWHTVGLTFREGWLRVHVDGLPLLETSIAAPDYAGRAMGFTQASFSPIQSRILIDYLYFRGHLLEDMFDTPGAPNPGRWDVTRHAGVPSEEALVDSDGPTSFLRLTQKAPGRAAAVDYAATSGWQHGALQEFLRHKRSWGAEFDYKVEFETRSETALAEATVEAFTSPPPVGLDWVNWASQETSGLVQALEDGAIESSGFTFLLYKRTGDYDAYGVGDGATLGFQTAGGGSIPGYGIRFATHRLWDGGAASTFVRVALVEGTAGNLLAISPSTLLTPFDTPSSASSTVEPWHHVRLAFHRARIVVEWDGRQVLNASVPDPDYDGRWNGFGLTGSSTWRNTWGLPWQATDDLTSSTLVDGLQINDVPFTLLEPDAKEDADGDGLPDRWTRVWYDHVEERLDAVLDYDGDDLTNQDEYRWGTLPACVPLLGIDHCLDFDQDGWRDGPEATYWDNIANNDLGQDPDRLLDTDADGVPNMGDPDSDGDGLLDGAEIALGTYPELWDSDCALAAPTCTRSFEVQSLYEARLGQPGQGDGWPDGFEHDTWTRRGAAADLDADTLPNVLDPDSDQDRLLDGQEQPYADPWDPDSEDDTLQDGDEVAWMRDSDGDGAPNARDPDSDDDQMPDGWETQHRLNMIDAGDAPLDPDGDRLVNLAEYRNQTDPGDMDTDRDQLLDGPEVLDHRTDPRDWDTDGDAMPDGFEASNGLRPLDALDEVQDPDADSYDEDLDGAWDLYWSNRDEYEYQRPASWREETDGPWPGGTLPQVLDTDEDGVFDGYEAYYEQPARIPSPPDDDRDGDGLGFLAEAHNNTDPRRPDTDGDGVCDGGRGPNCTRGLPGGGVGGGFPGEVLDYGSDPRDTDTDADGLSDHQEALRWDPAGTGRVPDADGDGRSNLVDPDADNDGLWDLDELVHPEPSDPQRPDTDGDGLQDGVERVGWPVLPDLAQTRTSHPNRTDTDGDGANDTAEFQTRLDPRMPDTDGDGLCDGGRTSVCHRPGREGGGWPGEADYGSLAFATDSDSDGLHDLVEAVFWDGNATGVAADADGDLLNGLIDPDNDGDRLGDGAEALTHHTRPDAADTDGDGLLDGEEVLDYETLPGVPDSDGDRLDDGQEVKVTRTLPRVTDTDGDGLADGEEVLDHATDPLVPDTDLDGLVDAWEVHEGTLPRTQDAGQDPDQDGLVNAREYQIGTHPRSPHSDLDAMPDGYEADHGLDPLVNDAGLDLDLDGLANGAEHQRGTRPDQQDTDGDGLNDGPEVNTYASDPLTHDTDQHGLGDGQELGLWIGQAWSWNTDHDGDGAWSALADADSDGDRLDDGDEFTVTKTHAHDPDSDDDVLTDWDEVFQYGGQYDPHEYDTDGDGKSDGAEVLVDTDPEGDADRDGLPNLDEANVYETDPTAPDTDCDGAKDGPELTHWQDTWNSGMNRLLVPDVDADTILDGIEMGTAGSPRDALYRTRADLPDTEEDGLGDNQEDRNPFTVGPCPNQENSQAASSSSSSPLAWPPVPGPDFWGLVGQPLRQAWLDPDATYRDPQGLLYRVTSAGVYVVGAYGVELWPIVESPAEAVPVPLMGAASSGPAVSVKTNPTKVDTDGDGINDGQELWGSLNTFGNMPTDPLTCDSDGDRIGDGVEMGITAAQRPPQGMPDPKCNDRDQDAGGRSNPSVRDTDGDGREDGQEDTNSNGRLDTTHGVNVLCSGASQESAVADIDTDDDGVRDDDEILKGLNPACYDSDRDGLSDGLETGVDTPWPSAAPAIGGTDTTRLVNIAGRLWPTWQPWQGTTSNGVKITTVAIGQVTCPPLSPGSSSRVSTSSDSDCDGLIDGLEDVNHNGIFGDSAGELGGRQETNARAEDSDDDGLLDGREVLIYGSYTFDEALGAWAGSLSRLVFDLTKTTNPWITNPINKFSDQDEDGLVNVPDGKDLNPRGDALLEIKFGLFNTVEQNDESWAQNLEFYVAEFRVDIPIAASDFAGGVGADAAVKIGNPRQRKFLPNETVDDLRDSITGGAANLAWQREMGKDSNFLRLNLPEEFAPESSPLDMSTEIYVGAKDSDYELQDDKIDLNNQKPGEWQVIHEWGLDRDGWGSLNATGGHLVQGQLLSHAGALGDDGGGDVDAVLEITLGDSVPKYFLQGIQTVWTSQKAPPLSGRCLGDPACVRSG